MEWISVKDRLPNPGTDCVVYINGGKNHKYFRWGIFLGESWSGDGGHYMSHNLPEGLHNVTHWMSLPDPPEKEGILK
jgi:hypothetical protein